MSKKNKNEKPGAAPEPEQEAPQAAPEEPAPEEKEAPSPVQPEMEEAPKQPEPNPLEQQLAAEKDRYLRLAAEYDNYRKRSQKERDALFIDVRAETVLKLLPVYDNLERALKQQTEDQAFYKGVEMTMKQFKEIFASLNEKEIPAVGETFDPTLHNAVMHVEDDQYPKNTVIDEFQKGFMLGDKVIRFSVVRVAN